MLLLVNYANDRFADSQRLNTLTAECVGGFDRIAPFGPHDIDAEFAAAHRETLAHRRGGGYWLWKPYFIARSLAELADGDFLFYCDSGVYFLDSIQPLVAVCRRDGQDLIPFELKFRERDYTKRDAFVRLDCDRPEFTDTPQRLASFMLIRKTAFTVDFVSEWLKLAENPRLLTDRPNECGLDNYPGFEDHRHDQSLFSLLTKRHGLRAYRNPARPPGKQASKWPGSDYGQLLRHTRWKRVPLRIKLFWQVRHWLNRSRQAA